MCACWDWQYGSSLKTTTRPTSYHCLTGSLILHFKLPGKRCSHFSVLRKWAAKSSGTSSSFGRQVVLANNYIIMPHLVLHSWETLIVTISHLVLHSKNIIIITIQLCKFKWDNTSDNCFVWPKLLDIPLDFAAHFLMTEKWLTVVL